MSDPKRAPMPLSFKPGYLDALRRWEAYYAGEIIDRPLVNITARKPGYAQVPGTNYRQRVFDDIDTLIDNMLAGAEATYYAGESIPSGWLSFGPDEIAYFCGAELGWNDKSGDTNWSKPFVDDWAEAFPLRLREDNPLWRRMLDFYRRAAVRTEGKMLLCPLDLHTNMDLLMAFRGSERLCLDLIDQPQVIDRAMADARAIFRQVWDATAKAGRMDERGYCHLAYSMEGAAVLQCDFCCMMGPAMFRRWVLPALEEEAEIVKHVVFHWDGKGALTHTDDLVASRGLHTLAFQPGDGGGSHLDYIDLFQRIQAGGKSVQVWGNIDQIKELHRHLRPEKTLYCTWANTPQEADQLLEWFVKNT